MGIEPLLSIDGHHYEVRMIKLSRSASILDKYANRTLDGVAHREIIGVFVNYSLTFAYHDAPERYDEFWQKLIEPVEWHDIILPRNIGYTSPFQAYISNVKDNIEYANPNNNYERRFNGLSCDITSRAPNLTAHRG